MTFNEALKRIPYWLLGYISIDHFEHKTVGDLAWLIQTEIDLGLEGQPEAMKTEECEEAKKVLIKLGYRYGEVL